MHSSECVKPTFGRRLSGFCRLALAIRTSRSKDDLPAEAGVFVDHDHTHLQARRTPPKPFVLPLPCSSSFPVRRWSVQTYAREKARVRKRADIETVMIPYSKRAPHRGLAVRFFSSWILLILGRRYSASCFVVSAALKRTTRGSIVSDNEIETAFFPGTVQIYAL